MLKIEKNIALPAPVGGAHALYPFSQMKVGDSFYIANPPLSARSTLFICAARKKVRIAIRQNGKGLRVWRIK